MQKTPYPYCVHGVYVGGCGVDYMCGACEMGDPNTTPREQRDYIRSRYSRGMELAVVLTRAAVKSEAYRFMIARVDTHLLNLASELRLELDKLKEIELWAEHEDDDEWIYRRHAEAQRLWNEAEGEEQFWSLPVEVLDGP